MTKKKTTGEPKGSAVKKEAPEGVLKEKAAEETPRHTVDDAPPPVGETPLTFLDLLVWAKQLLSEEINATQDEYKKKKLVMTRYNLGVVATDYKNA